MRNCFTAVSKVIFRSNSGIRERNISLSLISVMFYPVANDWVRGAFHLVMALDVRVYYGDFVLCSLLW